MCDNDFAGEASNSQPLSAECLRYYDEIRFSPDVVAESKPSSQVLKISQNNNTSLRLCHLTSMLPSTSGNGVLQPDFGLYTEGAGLLAMIHFNARDESIVPDVARIKDCNVRFTMEFQDTQFSPIEACRAFTVGVLSRTHSLQTPRPVSLVGATRSAVTGPLAILAGGVPELPLVSYGSTSSQLDAIDTYPYFARTVPTNVGDAQAVVSYLRNVLGITHCGVIFVKDGYGTAFHREFLLASQQVEPPMTVLSAPYEPSSTESMVSAVENLRQSGYRLFFGIISTPTYDSVMREAYRAGIAGLPGYSWFLTSDSGQLLGGDFGYDASSEADLAAASSGVGIFSLEFTENEAFADAWRTLESNPGLKEYFVSKHDPELNFSDFEFYDTPTYWEYLQYDAVMALGFAACEATDEYFTGPSLFETLVQTSFRGASGLVNFEQATGTRNYSSLNYKLMNVVARPPNERGRITYDSYKTSFRNGTEWVHVKPFVYSDGTTTAPSFLPPLHVDFNLIDDAVRIVGLTLAAIFMAMSVGFAVWTLIYRKSLVVRFTQPFFLVTICVGTFLMAAAVIPMSLQEPTDRKVLDAACMFTPWLLSIGFIIAFSALLSKTLRINKLAALSAGFRRVNVRIHDVLVPFLVLFSLNLIILASWTAVAPLKWMRIETNSFDQYGRQIDSYGTCQSEDTNLQLVFYVLLASVDLSSLIFANVANYRARKLSSNLHEASAIAISLAIMLEAAVIGIPALIVASDSPTSFFIVRALIVAVICGAILIPLFVPKMIQAKKDGYATTAGRSRLSSTVVAAPRVSRASTHSRAASTVSAGR